MRKLLLRIFIKKYQNISDPDVRKKYGTLSGAVGIVTNMLLAAVKIILGTIGSSIAIIADRDQQPHGCFFFDHYPDRFSLGCKTI